MSPGMIAVVIVVCYLGLLLGLGLFSNRFFRGTSAEKSHLTAQTYHPNSHTME